jgi:excisionase family DNA binding protein
MKIIDELEKRRKVMTVDEVTEILAGSSKTVYRMARESSLPYRVRGSLRFDPDDIINFMKQQKPAQIGRSRK